MNARMLLRFDAAGCAAATVVAGVRGGWVVALLLAISAVGIGVASAVPDRWLRTVLHAVGLANMVWAAGVVAVLAASWVDGVDAVLVGLTAPYTVLLGARQLRAARTELVASGA